VVHCSAQIIVKEGISELLTELLLCNFAAFKVANGVPEWVKFRVDDVVDITKWNYDFF
jgi:hypothetical protein